MLTLEVYKVSPYIPLKMFTPFASEIWTESYGPNYTKFWAFRQKTGFGRRYCSWNDLKTIIFQCSKNYGTPTPSCNQVKSCTKHGRPDQSQRELTVALSTLYSCLFCEYQHVGYVTCPKHPPTPLTHTHPIPPHHTQLSIQTPSTHPHTYTHPTTSIPPSPHPHKTATLKTC